MTPTGDGRVYEMRQRVRLGDTTASGRLRLDAAARYLQDVAADDSADAALPAGRGWVLRRMNLEIARLPRLDTDLSVRTACSGVGGRWAERTTVIAGTAPGLDQLLRARAVWVSVDVETRAPVALAPEFFAVYGESVRDHRVSARLTHPRPPADAIRIPWPRRSSDIDVLGHINNAVYWVPIEDWLRARGATRTVARASIEFGAGVSEDEECEITTVTSGAEIRVWFRVGDDVRASIVAELGNGPSEPGVAGTE